MLLDMLLLSFEEMKSFTSYLLNWLTDTSNSKPLRFPHLMDLYSHTVFFFFFKGTELVDTPDFSEPAYELVMQLRWLILSKTLYFAFINNYFLVLVDCMSYASRNEH